MRFSRLSCGSIKPGGILLWMFLTLAMAAWGQQPVGYDHHTAIDQANSRAEQEAEQLVSLSADKIIFLLRQETGLLLQVKKAIVREAFEQGRVVGPADLTDDGLFSLVREDEKIRVLATREIEDRYYIQAKPTREELVRSIPCRGSATPDLQTLPTKGQTQGAQNGQLESSQLIPSQEELYWGKHENDLDCYSLQNAPYDLLQSLYRQILNAQMLNGQYPSSQYPQRLNLQPQYPQEQYPQPEYPQQYPPSQSAPQNQPINPLRQLQLTQLEAPW